MIIFLLAYLSLQKPKVIPKEKPKEGPRQTRYEERQETYYKKPEPRQIFNKASHFFDSVEQRKLYQALSKILSESPYSIFPQVRLADIVRTNPSNSYDKEMYIKTLPYQLDFVICYGSTCQIRLAIELDSPYHHNIQQQERDLFKSKVLADAQIPLLRLRVEEKLTHEALISKLRQYLPL